MDENYDELLSLITHGVEIEKKIARGNMNQFLDCLKLENALIFGSKYLETFSSMKAKERLDIYRCSILC
ncbi:hypothetical protein [uncultured Bacteroides sp.]|uniref:hypothetical protein n=1 Tax=uncultured Bacteroides sp. TaxID=162156 RepID=UPI002603051E|nr:hypothetical protein [uncultured Bacteroides sp.]